MKILVTGGAGFIGSELVRQLIATSDHEVVNVDALTYAASLASLTEVEAHPRYAFEHANICDAARIAAIFQTHQPDSVMHLAAESHVDRSIEGPGAFIQTNIVGTFVLLEQARRYMQGLSGERRDRFRFCHVSTDEVFGSLGEAGAFSEDTPYSPRSPYSASKAASDHLARAWQHTYGLPVVVSNCSNNYGPYQFPEKMIPLMIVKGLRGEAMPVYGKGENVRDWLFVSDHAEALRVVLDRGVVGESYNLGGESELSNIDLVRRICTLLDEKLPTSPHAPHERLITFVADRPGHDLRYAMDIRKVQRDLGWSPRVDIDAGLAKTIDWYIARRDFWEPILEGRYDGTRLGLASKPSAP